MSGRARAGRLDQDKSGLPAPAPDLPWALARCLDLDQQRAAGPKERSLTPAWGWLAGKPFTEICPIAPAWGPFTVTHPLTNCHPLSGAHSNKLRVAK